MPMTRRQAQSSGLQAKATSYTLEKLEFLGLKWAITDHVHDYLFHAPHLTVYSDNNPLTYVMKTAKLNAAGQWCVSELADYRFTLKN